MEAVEDGVFELYCVKDGILSQAQIEKAVREQQVRADRGESFTLEQVILGLGMLDQVTVEGIKARLDPELIPGYRIHGVLGRGGMGTVYRATQLSMQREVAMKILSLELSKDQKFCQKFLMEARNSAKLNHENIMGGIDCGESNGLHYFVMELVEGESLADVVDRDGPLPVDRVFTLLEQVAKGLKHAHEQRIVHRDIKPDNIMVTTENIVKICDLGLARPEVQAGTGEKGGVCEGTPYYCAPEQARGLTDIDARADIYALGMTLYHLLVGEVAFDGPDARSILVQQVQTPFPDIQEKVPGLSSSQAQLIKAMVVKDRASRLESMDDLLGLIASLKSAPKVKPPTSRRTNNITESMPPQSSSVLPIIIGVAIALTLAVGGILLAGMGEKKDGDSDNPDKPKPIVNKPDKPKDPPVKPSVINISLDKPKKPPVKPDQVVVKPDAGSLKERQAKRLLAKAQEFQLNNPEKTSEALGLYRQVVDQFPDSVSAATAKMRIAKLVESSEQRLKTKWLKVQTKARNETKAGRYRAALTSLEKFRESYDSSLIKSFVDDIQALTKQISGAARAELTKLETSLANTAKAGGADQANARFAAFAKRAPEDLQGDIAKAKQRVLEIVKKSQAQNQARDLVANVRNALFAGDLKKAKTLLDFAKTKPALASATAITKMRLEYVAVARLWDEFDANVEKWKGEARRFKMSDDESVKATMQNYDRQRQAIQLKVYGRNKILSIEFSDLAVDEILALNSPAASMPDRLQRVRFLIYRGLSRAAKQTLESAKEAGFDDKAVEADLAAALVKLKNFEAEKLWDRIKLTAKTPEDYDDTMRLANRLINDYVTTTVIKQHAKELRDVYVTAAARKILEEEPEKLFNCEARRKSKRDLKYELKYNFEDPEQKLDFIADRKTLAKSSVTLKDEELGITGRIQHCASWLGGGLEIKMKVQCKNDRRPNINLMLSDQGGFRGTFVGIGSRMQATEVTLDASAKRGGAKVLLPANLIADAGADGFKYVFADRRPVLKTSPDKVLKYVLNRTRRGGLQVKIGSKTFIGISKNLPNHDQAGRIGFYLDGVELVIHEFVIEGVLDPTWAEEHAKTVATRSVNERLAKVLTPPGKAKK